MTTPYSTIVERTRRLWLWRLWAFYAIRILMVWLFVAGTLVGGWRLAYSLPVSFMPAGLGIGLLAVLAMALLVALIISERRCPAPKTVLALLDGANAGGGLLAAVSDGLSLDGWDSPATKCLPMPVHDGRRILRLSVLGALFFLGCSLIPLNADVVRSRQKMDVKDRVEALKEEIRRLADADLLKDKEAATLEERVDSILEDSQGTDPVKTLDELDYAKESLENKAAEAMQGLENAANAFQKAEAGMRALEKMAADKTMSAEQQLAALRALMEMLETAAAANAPLTPEMQQKMAELAQVLKDLDQQTGAEAGAGMSDAQKAALKAALTPELLAKMAAAMKLAGASAQQNLQKLAAQQAAAAQGGHAGSPTPEEIQQMLERLNQMSAEEIAEAMRQAAQQAGQGGQGMTAGMMMFGLGNGGLPMPIPGQGQGQGQGSGQGGSGQGKGVAQGQGGQGGSGSGPDGNGAPGSGGVSRGRGDAALTWRNGGELQPDQYKRGQLPGATTPDMAHSEVVGITLGDPGEAAIPAAPATASGALSTSAAGTASSRKEVVLPRHREAVKKYFERK
jgi:hypothetical protein